VSRAPASPLLSVYDGRTCIGFVLSRGKQGFEAVRADDDARPVPHPGRGGRGVEDGARAMTPIDKRLAFIHRAAARLRLVEAGDMDIDGAVDDLLRDELGLCACEIATGRRQRFHEWGVFGTAREAELAPTIREEAEAA
jgi:hypothetical protein